MTVIVVMLVVGFGQVSRDIDKTVKRCTLLARQPSGKFGINSSDVRRRRGAYNFSAFSNYRLIDGGH